VYDAKIKELLDRSGVVFHHHFGPSILNCVADIILNVNWKRQKVVTDVEEGMATGMEGARGVTCVRISGMSVWDRNACIGSRGQTRERSSIRRNM
jgi:hypothetical protein